MRKPKSVCLGSEILEEAHKRVLGGFLRGKCLRGLKRAFGSEMLETRITAAASMWGGRPPKQRKAPGVGGLPERRGVVSRPGGPPMLTIERERLPHGSTPAV